MKFLSSTIPKSSKSLEIPGCPRNRWCITRPRAWKIGRAPSRHEAVQGYARLSKSTRFTQDIVVYNYNIGISAGFIPRTMYRMSTRLGVGTDLSAKIRPRFTLKSLVSLSFCCRGPLNSWTTIATKPHVAYQQAIKIGPTCVDIRQCQGYPVYGFVAAY